MKQKWPLLNLKTLNYWKNGTKRQNSLVTLITQWAFRGKSEHEVRKWYQRVGKEGLLKLIAKVKADDDFDSAFNNNWNIQVALKNNIYDRFQLSTVLRTAEAAVNLLEF